MLYVFFSFSLAVNFDSGSDESTETSATDNAKCKPNTSSQHFLHFHRPAADFSFFLRHEAASLDHCCLTFRDKVAISKRRCWYQNV